VFAADLLRNARGTTRNAEKRLETKGNDRYAEGGPERPWSGHWTRRLSEGDLFTVPHLLIDRDARSPHTKFDR